MLRRSRSLILLVSATVSLGFAIGCNPGEAIQQAQNAAKREDVMRHLKELGLAYHNYHDAHWESGTGKGAPESWEHLQEAGLSGEARQTLEREGYKLVLGLEFSQATIGTSNFMIAYPANPTGERFLVGMMDGSARSVDRTEFDELRNMQQPLLAEAIVIEPPAGASASSSATGATAPNPNVPPPPPSGS